MKDIRKELKKLGIEWLVVLAHVSLVWGLWNWIVPGMFGLPEVTWLKALGLWWLCRLLFKSRTAPVEPTPDFSRN